jgi:hypothetical protein
VNAYVLTWEDECDEPCGEVVFAADETAARAAGARFGLDAEDRVDVRHEPAFDVYAAQGRVPLAALLAAGWCYPCAEPRCGRTIDDGTDGEDEEVVTLDEAVLDGEEVWCSEACHAATLLRREWQRAVVAYVRERLPDARDVSAWQNNDGVAVEWRSPRAKDTATLTITSGDDLLDVRPDDYAVYREEIARLRGEDETAALERASGTGEDCAHARGDAGRRGEDPGAPSNAATAEGSC